MEWAENNLLVKYENKKKKVRKLMNIYDWEHFWVGQRGDDNDFYKKYQLKDSEEKDKPPSSFACLPPLLSISTFGDHRQHSLLELAGN